MTNKVVYFSFMPITDFVIKKYNIKDLKNAGFQVEYWDLRKVFPFPGVPNTYDDSIGVVVEFDSYSELKKRVYQENPETTLYISQITYTCDFYKLFRLFNKTKSRVAVMAVGMLPIPDITDKDRWKVISWYRVKRFLLNKLTKYYLKLNILDYYQVIFKVGNLLESESHSHELIDIFKASFVTDINSTDYDFALEIQNDDKLIFNPYILFLDDYLPFHPDTEIERGKEGYTISPESFYTSLNSLFDNIEKQTGKKVIIAAHPKAEKYKTHNYFNSRPVFFGKTNLLARDADMLLAFGSTTIGYATIYHKPIILLSSNDIRIHLPYYYKFIVKMRDVLNVPVVSIDKPLLALPDAKIDEARYDAYKYTYLTSPTSEHTITKERLINAIRKL